MKSIKEQIDALLLSYRESFKEATGMELVVYVKGNPHKRSLDHLVDVAEEIFQVDPRNKRRYHAVTRVRRMVIAMALELGYSVVDISGNLGIERTACYGIEDYHQGAITVDKVYRKEYELYKATVQQ